MRDLRLRLRSSSAIFFLSIATFGQSVQVQQKDQASHPQ
ncbi:hypothetical protein ACPOL_7034 (plasmid) [Acidisarcina polymorpha]|uniref:Uncharacterized protein n=1 Tax=Acidisarcina polymorpha TaxID=2211140 RepID=A0A2Z5GBY6_9BACT|nr:hypothetical protein ACPOL_7034 [Acidisarcina polymorpha]